MLKRRIIPCLDIKDGRTVKGVNFKDLKDAGDPVALAKIYSKQGADELVFLDISATDEQRKTLSELVSRIASEINIPFTVGGGIYSVEDAAILLNAGADKISINTAAVENPDLIKQIATRFGSQCVVIAVDAILADNDWYVVTHAGKENTHIKVIDWVKKCEELGAGEILLTSMNTDGTKKGFAIDLTNMVCEACSLPVIASGGAGKKEDFLNLFRLTNASGGLAASIFHYGEVPITGLKRYLASENIPVRLLMTNDDMEETIINADQIDFKKGNGLVPAIIQHYQTGNVLMLGYMNEKAFSQTKESGLVTFYSRSRQTLWVKGETSKNYLHLKSMYLDRDKDTLLILAEPDGPTCHTGEKTCFGEETYTHSLDFLKTLEQVIASRRGVETESSYTSNLFRKGINYITKKFGEESSEVIIAALAQDNKAFKGEVSDLLYHLLVLLNEKSVSLDDIVKTLKDRHVK